MEAISNAVNPHPTLALGGGQSIKPGQSSPSAPIGMPGGMWGRRRWSASGGGQRLAVAEQAAEAAAPVVRAVGASCAARGG